MADTSTLLVMIGIISIACQLIAFRFRFPAILALLFSGILIGPVFNLFDTDALFGDLLFPLISLAVAIILFEGALTLNFKDVAGHGSTVRNLCTIGALITWLVMAPVAHYAAGIAWEIAFLFGAIVTVTGPTVIIPMLRTVRPTPSISNILRWEGIIIDPIGALLAVLVFEFIVSSQHALLHTLQTFGLTLFCGISFGCAGGYILGLVLRNNWVPHYLRNTAVLTLMLGCFAASNTIAHESGLLTVTIMGIWLANMDKVELEDILEFKETLSVLLISALFILLAARIDLHSILQIGFGSIIIVAALMFLARPVGVIISAYGSELSWRELVLLSWISPRGIVAAAVSALFAIRLGEMNYAGAELLVPMVFLVIITTVVVQSLTAGLLAKALNLRSSAPRGILIFGANKFSRMLATELLEHGVNVKIADTNWDAIREARMENIPTYYGNPISEHAERTLDLSNIGQVLVMSPYRQLNPLITFHFEHAMGKNAVKGLQLTESESKGTRQTANEYEKRLGLFGEHISYKKLASLVAKGSVIKTTRLSDNYTIDDYLRTWAGEAIPLCAIAPNGSSKWFTAHSTIEPKSDWEIVSLISPEGLKAMQQQKEVSKSTQVEQTKSS